jgi:hypothetical protein
MTSFFEWVGWAVCGAYVIFTAFVATWIASMAWVEWHKDVKFRRIVVVFIFTAVTWPYWIVRRILNAPKNQ